MNSDLKIQNISPRFCKISECFLFAEDLKNSRNFEFEIWGETEFQQFQIVQDNSKRTKLWLGTDFEAFEHNLHLLGTSIHACERKKSLCKILLDKAAVLRWHSFKDVICYTYSRFLFHKIQPTPFRSASLALFSDALGNLYVTSFVVL